jgi:Protein of unknown function (DUF2800)
MSDSDPRRGLPSASAMWQVANCPGRQTLVNALRAAGKHYELPAPAATRGIRIHQFLAQGCPYELAGELSNEELMIAYRVDEIRNEIVKQWDDGRDPADGSIMIEERLWYRQGLTVRFSGQPDYVYRRKKRALILNFKTGRKEAMPAADNLQLRTEIVLLKHLYPELTEISGAIVEPLVTWEPERVQYKEADLAKAEAQILHFVDIATWNRDERVAGPWCTYCPARAYCREALDYVQSIPNPEGIIKELPRGEDGARLWEKIKLAKQMLETLEATYEQILEEEPGALPGYILPKEGRARRQVVDPAKLKESFAPYLSSEELDGCAEFRLGAIEKLLAAKHRIDMPREAAKLVSELAQGAVAIVHDKPFIRPLSKVERKAALSDGH